MQDLLGISFQQFEGDYLLWKNASIVIYYVKDAYNALTLSNAFFQSLKTRTNPIGL